jgi:hypothetical protein
MSKDTNMKLRVYLAQKMTGLSCKEILKKAKTATKILEDHGLEVWSPAIEEKIPNSKKPLTVLTKEDLLAKWLVDKKVGLRTCHILLDIDGDLSSEGVNVERGNVRWYLWRPTIRVKSPGHTYSISNIEDDFIASSVRQAAIFIKRRWGTRRKWVMWKLNHIIFGIPKLVWIQIKSLWL